MEFLTPLLVSVCVGVTSQYNPACQKAVEATYVQTGYAAEVSKFQAGVTEYGKKKESAVFGNKTALVNTIVLTGVAVKNKKATIPLPNFGLCNSMSTTLQSNSAGLNFGWSW
jgi:hypothetical protein